MKYEIRKNEDGIDIAVADVANQQQGLLAAFRECQEGRCSCPTEEYKKLDTLEISQSEAGLALHLKARDGEVFDSAEIEKCLNYTAGRLRDAT
ncbi:MAG: hypothetical protein PHH36_00865 [Sideroxydans sp.]|nr:hypothetical protein [Sideroxydans sp.]